MKSSEYDLLMVKSLGEKHLKPSTVYYDDAYFGSLKNFLEKDGVLKEYAGELTANSKGIKMCSIASSSRFCYLSSKTIYKDITHHEKKDIKNDCCRPHYDGYSSKTNTYYEFKCHEFCDDSSHNRLSTSYTRLLKSVYDITEDPNQLRFSHFGMKISDDPSIYEINFDFKQFLCHVFGILAAPKHPVKPSLKYVWVVPDVSSDKHLQDFIKFIRDEINSIFSEFRNVEANYNGAKSKIDSLIDFSLDVVPCSKIPDFVLNSLKQH